MSGSVSRTSRLIPGIHWVGGWVSLFGWSKRKIGLMEDRKQRIDTPRLGIKLFNNTVPSADGREKVKFY